jgi:hypothetical protein
MNRLGRADLVAALSWPRGELSFLGSVLMIVGGGMAAGQTERQRTTPGVL